MIKIKLILVCCVFMFGIENSLAAQVRPILVSNVIQGAISMSDRVPTGFFGSWKVFSVRSKTTNPEEFGPSGVDIWNLSKSGDVITLSNPVSGAKASIRVGEVNGSTVRFEKISYDQDEESIETPILTLEGDNFYGIDRIVVKSYKNGNLLKEDSVEYKVKAIKVSGATLPNLFGY